MPELPEVETVKNGIAPFLLGAKIKNISFSQFRLRFEYPIGFAQHIIGTKFKSIRRRAKYIIADLENDFSIIIHLGMSGRISLVGNGQTMSFDDYVYQTGAKTIHDHVIVEIIGVDGNEIKLIYNDPRRFGLWDLVETTKIETSKHFAHLGPEPLNHDFTCEILRQRIGKKQAPIKLALLNQEIVVGLGNIYVCEALFKSKIHPERPANSLSAQEAALLVQNSKSILTAAIGAGGSTLNDYRQADGNIGSFQTRFDVYDRNGEICKTSNCGSKIEKITQGGRSTFFCAKCQI
jgi:formamidopyrimidine-DNA glycosylase